MTYAEQLRADYAAVRARLYNPPTRVPDSLPAPVCRDVKIVQEEPEPTPEPEIKPKKKRRGRRLKANPTSAKAKRLRENRRLDSQYNVRHALLVPNPGGQRWIEIVNRVTLETGVTLADMKSRSPIQRIARAAARAAYLMREEIGPELASLPWIAERIGRDHSTILTAIRRYKKRNGIE